MATTSLLDVSGGVGFEPPAGGLVAVQQSEGAVRAPHRVGITPRGASFGPLELSTVSNSTVVIDRLQYLGKSGSSADASVIGGCFAGAAGVDAVDNENPGSVNRRGLLLASGAALATAFHPTTGRARGASGTYTLARLEITENDGGTWIGLHDVFQDVLPPEQTYFIDLDGTRLEKLTRSCGYGTTIPLETTGTVRLYAKSGLGSVNRFTAWLQGLFHDRSITMSFQLEQSAREYSPGTEIVLSSHEAVANPVCVAGPSGTTATLAGNTLSHRSESTRSTAGSIGRADGALVYEVGDFPPEADRIELEVSW